MACPVPSVRAQWTAPGLNAILPGMPQSTAVTGRNYSSGIAAIAVSSLLFSVMAIMIRLAARVDFFTIALYRFAAGTAVLGTLALLGRIRLDFVNSKALFLRGLFGGFAVLFFYMSVVKIGLAKGTVISYVYPIFAMAGGVLFLKDRVRVLAWVLAGLGLGGMVLLVTPGPGDAGLDLWTILSLVGAVSAGAAIVSLKKATATDSSYAIYLAQCLVGFWIVAVPAVRGGQGLSWGTGFLLVAIALAATAAQLLMTWGFGSVPITAGSLLGLLTPVFNVIVGLLFFGETLSGVELAGSALVLASCVGVVLLDRAPSGAAQPRAPAA
jgi:drug/metabolite transporter (DMT)-like permease